MFNPQSVSIRDDNEFYYDDSSLISPTSALFPPELTEPYMDSNSHLTVPNNHHPSRSINTSSHHTSTQQGGQGVIDYSQLQQLQNQQQQYISRVPSLSPSSSGNHTLSHTHSPHSSASPSSNFSSGNNTDDFLLSNSFSSNEIDMLLFQNDFQSDYQLPNNNNTQSQTKPGQSLFIPSHRDIGSFGSDISISNLGFGSGKNNNNNNNNNPQSYQNQTIGANYQDDPFDVLNYNYVDPNGRRFSTISSQSDYPSSNPLPSVQAFTHQAQQPQSSQQEQQQLQQWVNPSQTQFSMGSNAQFPPFQPAQPFNNVLFEQANNQVPIRRSAQPKPNPTQISMTKQTTATRIVKPLRNPTNSINAQTVSAIASSTSPPDQPTGPVVGKHNKTERRYRQKVQAAQSDLRDAVPALRVLYGTSTEEQKQTTDIRAADGTVDGLGEVTRPNASAKATVLIGARMYIELLQRRVSKLQRKVDELETFRMAVAGQDDLVQWQNDFEKRESERESSLPVKLEHYDDDDEDDEEEMVVPKKRGRMAKDAGVRVFAAFAMSFSLLPSASNLFQPTDLPTSASTFETAPSSSSQVLSRLPLITAEHSARLLHKVLPNNVVPHPTTMVDWAWRLVVALVLVVLLGPVIKWSRKKETVVGRPGSIIKDSFKWWTGGWILWKLESEIAWNELAASILGGAMIPSFLVKLHVLIHLNRTASDAYSLALLALLQPELALLRSPEQVWQNARSHVKATTAPSLKAVLDLPYEEAVRSLDLLPATHSPISAISEQITLVHLNDLYSRLFVRLVDASTSSTSSSSSTTTLKTLLANLESQNLGKSFQATSFDKEIKGVLANVPKNTTSHSLGLVLIGLWGIFTGPSAASQAALLSALAAAELQGPSLPCVSAMLELLYPGSSLPQPQSRSSLDDIAENAKAVDKLALVIIGYINLLLSAAALNNTETRLQRLESSVKVQKATGHLRLVLTQTRFVGLAHDGPELEVEHEGGGDLDDVSERRGSKAEGSKDEEEEGFESAKEKFVGVLSVLGRRASGRAGGRDEDSGLEGDVEEL